VPLIPVGRFKHPRSSKMHPKGKRIIKKKKIKIKKVTAK
jgi:hypothetical protein